MLHETYWYDVSLLMLLDAYNITQFNKKFFIANHSAHHDQNNQFNKNLTLIQLLTTTPTFANSVDPDQMA